jgi:ATP-binding cassette, subfamily B, multidrug efflux pump
MSSLRRIVPFLQPYDFILWMGLLLVVLPVAMELLVPWLLQGIIDEGIRTGDLAAIQRGSLIMLASAVAGAVATLGQGYYRARLSQGIAFDMRNSLFAHIQRLSSANLDQLQTGQLMTRLGSDVNQVRMFLSAGVALLLRAILMIAGSVVMLLLTDLRLALIVLGLLALAGLLIRLIMQTATPLFTIVQEQLAALNTLVQENLAGVQVVKAFVRERFAIQQFAEGNAEYTDVNIRAGRILALASPLLTLITNIGLVAILWLGGRDTIGGRLSVGELVAFNNYLLIGMAPLLLLSNMLTMVSRAEASAERILDVLDTQPAIQPPATPANPARMAGRLVFDQVSFYYGAAPVVHPALNGVLPGPANGIPPSNGATTHPGESQPVLHKVSFVVEPGRRVALLGATGSGKSTLISLIPRFYDVTSGRISIDGVDVRAWDLTALRQQIGLVLQRTTLFSGTVHENIAYGRPEATREEVIAAAQAAQAHDFILALPEGYDSHIEERGMNLSGGQKQRIAIARALLVSPAILILDDSTSALDLETEFRLQGALDRLMVGRTTLIVAQRINSVLNADQILVLDRGQIVAQGTHSQLLAHSPIYGEIYRSQLGEQPQGSQS